VSSAVGVNLNHFTYSPSAKLSSIIFPLAPGLASSAVDAAAAGSAVQLLTTKTNASKKVKIEPNLPFCFSSCSP